MSTNGIRHRLQRAGDAATLLRLAAEAFGGRLGLAMSFSAEDVIALDLLARADAAPRVFAIDTGRLPEATLAFAETLRDRYGIRIDWVVPDHAAVETLVRAKGQYSFRASLENRLECCRIRKVEPLQRALRGLDAWVTGQRREQSPTRAALDTVEIDAANGGLLKLNPLASWTRTEVWQYVERQALPRHPWYAAGYASFGCTPCSRTITAGEDERAGRWWWEAPEHKECGLHRRHAVAATAEAKGNPS